MNSYEQARLIEIKTRRLVQQALVGGYRSAFRGVGLDFDEVRQYTPGDDIRHINWQVTARAQQPFVKRYVEERQLTLLLLVDVSGSTAFGSGWDKREMAAELAAVLATAAHFNQDRAGMLLFSDQIEVLVKPGQGRNHILRLIHTLLTHQPSGYGTDIDLALQTAECVLKQRGVVVLLSDLLAPPERYQQRLARLNRRHDVAAIRLYDPLERTIPNVGLLALQDSETGRRIWVDTADPAWRQTFAQQAAAHETAVARALRQAGVDCLSLATDENWLPSLAQFFGRRGRVGYGLGG
jgi:uncharacterized protein (DUF58 family)